MQGLLAVLVTSTSSGKNVMAILPILQDDQLSETFVNRSRMEMVAESRRHGRISIRHSQADPDY